MSALWEAIAITVLILLTGAVWDAWWRSPGHQMDILRKQIATLDQRIATNIVVARQQRRALRVTQESLKDDRETLRAANLKLRKLENRHSMSEVGYRVVRQR